MNQTELLSPIRSYRIYDQANKLNEEVTTLVNDTRQVIPGSCFIAIRGEHFDGHSAIQEVIQDGAGLVIVEEVPEDVETLSTQATIVVVPSTFRAQAFLSNQFYGEPSTKLNLVAVTGTNGKTTTANMINDLLEGLDRKTGMIGTMHYKVDQSYYPAVNTTPNSMVLQGLFHEMVDAGVTDTVIEASSHALQLGRLWGTDVDCAVFTNLTREHIDFHKTMENYAYAKSLLFSQLGQRTQDGKVKLAVLNDDDEYASVMAQATSAEIVTYSLVNPNATAFSDNIRLLDNQTTFTLHIYDKAFEVAIPMLGTYNISNYMAAFLVMHEYYGYSPETIIEATNKHFEGVSGRMEVIDSETDFEVVVDFAHTPDALENVLVELNRFKKGRIITLFGHSGGNRDSGARPELGDILFKYSDEIVFTADNPRFEDVTAICEMMIQDHDEKPYTIIEKREEAVNFALELARENDIVLFAGKGGEPYQIIGDEKLPYNEAEYIKQQLEEMKLV
ncbi:UDP-N-acetylmuramoyl-L-alanyl-D-glutamate--2,6-diaminopimelate ligase [Aerococcaceae bacterium DSM 111176]|nr:UDP-N-acetylmuramoyl-L-alanyl-D-glutamate--2,6-diaminopimelate ligase [Aerococcaceae bacterium DSM 111176]